jgi:hypothetical protein
MDETLRRVKKPHCYLVYALAPESLSSKEAHRIFNAFVADRRLPLVIYHDHFIGQAGGVAIFFVENALERDALIGQLHLAAWHVEYRPLIFSHNPAAFDEQVAFTLRAYRNVSWEHLQRKTAPGDPGREATAAGE